VFHARDAAGQLSSLTLFHPEYYRTLAVRLYVYGGARAIPQDSTYVERSSPDGGRRRSFSSRDASRRTRPPSPTWTAPVTAAGRSSAWTPKQTPVPIEPLTRFRLLHEATGTPPAVRIFEYVLKRQ